MDGKKPDLPIFDSIVGVQRYEPAAHAQHIVVGSGLGCLAPHQPSEIVHILKLSCPRLPEPYTKAESLRRGCALLCGCAHTQTILSQYLDMQKFCACSTFQQFDFECKWFQGLCCKRQALKPSHACHAALHQHFLQRDHSALQNTKICSVFFCYALLQRTRAVQPETQATYAPQLDGNHLSMFMSARRNHE